MLAQRPTAAPDHFTVSSKWTPRERRQKKPLRRSLRWVHGLSDGWGLWACRASVMTANHLQRGSRVQSCSTQSQHHPRTHVSPPGLQAQTLQKTWRRLLSVVRHSGLCRTSRASVLSAYTGSGCCSSSAFRVKKSTDFQRSCPAAGVGVCGGGWGVSPWPPTL